MFTCIIHVYSFLTSEFFFSLSVTADSLSDSWSPSRSAHSFFRSQTGPEERLRPHLKKASSYSVLPPNSKQTFQTILLSGSSKEGRQVICKQRFVGVGLGVGVVLIFIAQSLTAHILCFGPSYISWKRPVHQSSRQQVAPRSVLTAATLLDAVSVFPPVSPRRQVVRVVVPPVTVAMRR